MVELVLASNNAKKSAELSQLLAPLGIQLRTQGEFNVPEAEEPHCTFVENALVKARHAARLTGRAALADDSGLCVAALGGAPGVLSARFAGEPRSDARNNARLLEVLEQVEDRRALFYCALVLVRHAEDPRPLIACGAWRGEILRAPRGDTGFGYDPLFFLPELEQSAAELGTELKNTLSHRANAMRLLVEALQRDPL